MTNSASFYTDWNFWTVVVAAAALFLSLLPYLQRWLRPPKLRVEVYDQIAVSHKVGWPMLQVHVGLRNVGGRETIVSQIVAELESDATGAFSLIGRNYVRSEGGSVALLSPFAVSPGKEWGHVVNFLPTPSRDDERGYRLLESRLRRDIVDKYEAREQQGQPKQLLEGDPALVAPLLQLFQNNFRWRSADYRLTIRLHGGERNELLASVTYRFVLFESDVAEMRELADDYKFGAGIYYDNTERRPWVFPTLQRPEGVT
ncbi:hypothetical protein [Cupriavidus campinensis]|uniref:DUF3592 domain-containing protein n=1 Tax=Cupriavidus campinensis TaxID=151783 RepID=A0ABY3EI86_9BURK|nr:hypothetical protein [Cupriavidus campinensis]TSP10641.1 hypothetical protein FGG12_21345 [Cupriavidus campinensis]